jgi:hypothetical protein
MLRKTQFSFALIAGRPSRGCSSRPFDPAAGRFAFSGLFQLCRAGKKLSHCGYLDKDAKEGAVPNVSKFKLRALVASTALAFCAFTNEAALAQSFPTTPQVETEPSLGAFKIILNKTFYSNVAPELASLGFTANKYNPYEFTSPNLYDPSTTVGLSAAISQTSFFSGTSVSVGDLKDQVSISNYSTVPVSYKPVQGNGNMIATAMESLAMTNSTTPANSTISILAGSATDPSLNIPLSYGMVQSINASADFNAQSFFDIFVEIALNTPDYGLVELTNFAPTGTTPPSSPLVVQNVPSEPITSLPPNNLYAHGSSQNLVPVYFANGPYAGQEIGQIALAQHAIGGGIVNNYLGQPGGGVGGNGGLSSNVANTPEPSTWAMMLIGFAGLGYAGYRRASREKALV